MLVALVAILSAYLLPFLVGRREVMRRSNADDRYSSELRVLATGDALASDASDEDCDGGGRAQIFRRRPEVKAMNRPAVRNVRALRTERELIRARQTHNEARERRRVAASHRAAVACTIMGVLLGLVVVCSLTALPWPSLAVPGVLLLVSVGAGRRAALASAALDRRERRRIAELEDELIDLTGERSAAPASVHPVRSKDEREVEPGTAAERTTAGQVAEAERADRTPAGKAEPAEGRTAAAERKAEPAARRAPAASEAAGSADSAAEAGGAAAVAAGTARPVERSSAPAAEAPSTGRRRPAVEEPAAEAERPAARSEGASVQQALMAVAWPVTELEADDGASSEPATDPERGAAPARKRETTAGGARKAASAAQKAVQEAVPATPPQGWHPVHVPAPTYTLAARAPRRALEELEETPYPSAPVPARPNSVRTLPTEGVEKEEIEFHPIDLDAVLEKRRAAGA